MTRITVLCAVMMVAVCAGQAEAQIRPGWYRGYPGYGYGGGYGYGTGYGDVIRSAGAYNLATSEALINEQEATSQYIDNSVKWVQAYHQIKRIGKEARNQEYAEQRATRDKWLAAKPSGAPPRLLSSQLDPSTGKIYWPAALETEPFANQRKQLEELYVLRAHTGVTAELAENIRDTARAMQENLKADIRTLPPNMYLDARKFLDSLGWEGQFAPGT